MTDIERAARACDERADIFDDAAKFVGHDAVRKQEMKHYAFAARECAAAIRALHKVNQQNDPITNGGDSNSVKTLMEAALDVWLNATLIEGVGEISVPGEALIALGNALTMITETSIMPSEASLIRAHALVLDACPTSLARDKTVAQALDGAFDCGAKHVLTKILRVINEKIKAIDKCDGCTGENCPKCEERGFNSFIDGSLAYGNALRECVSIVSRLL